MQSIALRAWRSGPQARRRVGPLMHARPMRQGPEQLHVPSQEAQRLARTAVGHSCGENTLQSSQCGYCIVVS